MEALKIALFVVLACFMQGQAVPVKKSNTLQPLLYITVAAAAYTGNEETQVVQLELDATIYGEPKSKHVDIRSVADMLNRKMASIQAQQPSENTAALGSENSLPLAVSVHVLAEVDINIPDNDVKTFGLDLTFNLWAQKKHNETLIQF
uniref:Uncharacterized protein n=2 Tax=Graphocephala atropunctata TaxID=36148 RepID=A0A1B6LFI1_9HEMI